MRILYLSDTDLCRGPMARVLSVRHAESMGVVGASFDSAGLWSAKPERPSREVIEFLRSDQVDASRHISKPLAPAQVRAADLIMCMTRRLAEKTRAKIEEPHRGKVLVLNDAVGFGKGDDLDILPPPTHAPKELLATYSRVKAATGRLVRLMRDGNMRPEDFGVKEVEAARVGYLDDPQLRSFLTRYVEDMVERANGGIITRDIMKALDVLGRPLSMDEVEELLTHDLRQKVRRNHLKKWEVVKKAEGAGRRAEPPRAEPPRAEPKEAKATSPRAEKAKAAAAEARAKERVEEQKKPGPKAKKMSLEEALEILSLKKTTTREEGQKTYRKLITRYHPDKFHDDDEFRAMAEEKTKKINEAWAVAEEELPE